MGFEIVRAARRSLCLMLLSPWLVSCGDTGFRDLDAYMAEKRARPGGVIEPIPTFKAYEAFACNLPLRSPFDRPIDVRELAALSHAPRCARTTIGQRNIWSVSRWTHC